MKMCDIVLEITNQDPKPKHGEDDATDDSEVGKPKSKRDSRDDWEGNMQSSTDGPIQNHNRLHHRHILSI